MTKISKNLSTSILWISLVFYLLPAIGHGLEEDLPCAPKSVGGDMNKIVCVCNETYCDNIGTILTPAKGQLIIYTSDKEGQRLKKSEAYFLKSTEDISQTKESRNEGFPFLKEIKAVILNSPKKIKIIMDKTKGLQKILGFGGAFTDSAGINIASLSEKLQNEILRSYFGPSGIGYTIGRVPIGGADFSPRPYTYDDNDSKEDVNLTNFSLQDEDLKYKIPFIKLAQTLEPNLLMYGSPWTASPWMKTNKNFKGRGVLKKKYHSVWANYILRFLKDYESHGIKMWGLTAQNEPFDGLIPLFPFNCMGWTASMQRDWIKNHIGPTLHENGFQDLKLMILDDNTILLPEWAKTVLSDPEAAKFISGVGVHWYSRHISGYDGIQKTSNLFPDKFVLATEACNGFLLWEENVDLGSWERAEEYAVDIIQQINNGAVGWTDWNIALDMDGGPNWANLGADSPIIVDSAEQQFYKQPTFYALAHFSKFLTRNAQVISLQMREDNGIAIEFGTTNFMNNLYAVGAIRNDNVVVLVILNKNESPVIVNLIDVNGTDGAATISIPAKSISTVMYLG